MRQPRQAISVLSILVVSFIGSQLTDAAEVNRLIAAVKENELVYRNIDATVLITYDIGGRRGMSENEEISRVEKIIYVKQNGKYRATTVWQSETEGGASSSGIEHEAFDGTTTRLIAGESVANIVEGYSPASSAIFPHALLLRGTSIRVPLSVFLSGPDAIAAHPLGNVDSERIAVTESLGIEHFNGLRCHRISVTGGKRSRHGRMEGRREFWLAEERNFLPVRVLSYSLRFSNDIPTAEGVVDTFEEIEPGIWFPMHASYASYDKDAVRERGEQTIRWHEVYATQDLSLSPSYPPSYFTDFTIPDGAIVDE